MSTAFIMVLLGGGVLIFVAFVAIVVAMASQSSRRAGDRSEGGYTHEFANDDSTAIRSSNGSPGVYPTGDPAHVRPLPDRDRDGIPDRTDPYPDDPTNHADAGSITGHDGGGGDSGGGGESGDGGGGGGGGDGGGGD